MKVKILKSGKYKEFAKSDGRKAQRLEAGAVVNFPQDYADYVITVGLAKEVAQGGKVEEPAAKGPAPAVEEPAATKKTRRGRAKKTAASK